MDDFTRWFKDEGYVYAALDVRTAMEKAFDSGNRRGRDARVQRLRERIGQLKEELVVEKKKSSGNECFNHVDLEVPA